MLFWLHDHSSNTRTSLNADGDVITIGRDDACTITLRNPFVARKHARILKRGNLLYVEPLGTAGTRVANREVAPGTQARLDFGDELQIGPYTLAPVGVDHQHDPLAADEAALREQLQKLEQQVHAELIERLNLRVTGHLHKQDERFIQQAFAQLDEVLRKRLPALDPHIVRLAVKSHLHRLTMAEVVRQCQGRVSTDYRVPEEHLLDAGNERRIHEIVATMVDSMPLLFDPLAVSEDLAVAEDAFNDLFPPQYDAMGQDLRQYIVRQNVAKDIRDIMLGLGPLTDLLAMPNVTEVMVVGKDRLYIEKNGVIQPTSRGFFSDEVLMAVIERILGPVGRRIDTANPLVDARLADGSRVHVVIPPLALAGPVLTIRKFGWQPFTMDDLVERQSVSEPVARFLQGCVLGKANMLISGGTGSGKTTLLNVLSAYARPTERIITVEESAELQLPQPHVVRLEGRPSNIEGRGAIGIRELVRNALRMRPDRIIIGEVRGPEALDMLQAMNTGHDGSLTTLHANTTQDAIKRLETLVLMAVEMPVRAIREQVATAIDLIVQVRRFSTGQRRVVQISEVTAIDPDTGQVRLEDIFTLKDADQARMRHTGYIPTFAQAMIDKGYFDVDVFL